MRVGRCGAGGCLRHGVRAAVYGCSQRGESALPPGPVLLERAITRVVVTFWARLRGFAALGLPKKGWGLVGPRHPFLRVVSGVLECSWMEELHLVD